MSTSLTGKQFAANLSRVMNDKQVIEMLSNALDAHQEVIDDYETFLALQFGVEKDKVHLCVKMGKKWVDGTA